MQRPLMWNAQSIILHLGIKLTLYLCLAASTNVIVILSKYTLFSNLARL